MGRRGPLKRARRPAESDVMADPEAGPSIKGSVFSTVVEDVNAALAAAGREIDLGRWLEPQDVGLLEQKIVVARWYDIQAYARMNQLLRDVAGGGRNDYLRDRGRHTARRLLEGGLYAQLEYAQRAEVMNAEPEVRHQAFGRDLRLLTTISASLLNFSRWAARPDPEHERRYLIEVSDAEAFPEVLCWRSDGFVNEMATQHGDADIWTWDRPSHERVVFRMVRSL